jgi:hypothetical protein
VTLSIAVAPSASVTVAITLQYDSPEAAAAGASAISDAISGGALVDSLAAIAPTITLETSVLPELPASPPPPGAATPAPAAAAPPPPAAAASPPAPAAGFPPMASPAAPAAAVVTSPDGKQRTVAIAVSLTVGVVIIVLGAVLTAVSRSSTRRSRVQAADEAEASQKLAPADSDDELSAHRPHRASSLLAAPTRRNSLLGVMVDGTDVDAAAQANTTALNRAHTSTVTPCVSRSLLLGALLGDDPDAADDDAPLPVQPNSPLNSDAGDASAGTSAPQRRNTPRSSGWRAPAVLSGDGEEVPLARSDSIRSNSGKTLRVRRSSVTK